MSVTFYPEQTTIAGYVVKCFCGVVEFEAGVDEVAKVDEFLDAYRKNPYQFEGCTDDLCPAYQHAEAVRVGPDHEGMNVSNMNARVLLEVLGLSTGADDELCGSCPAEDFLGRIMIAQAVAPVSAEIPAHDISREGGATMIHCGRPEGYVQDRLVALRRVAEFAVKHQRDMLWC